MNTGVPLWTLLADAEYGLALILRPAAFAPFGSRAAGRPEKI